MLKGKTHHIMIIFFNCIEQRRSSANWNILITFSEVTNIFSELGIGTIECSKSGADPGFGQGGAPGAEAESCQRSEAELRE